MRDSAILNCSGVTTPGFFRFTIVEHAERHVLSLDSARLSPAERAERERIRERRLHDAPIEQTRR
jgi:hypothetical protein